MKNETIYIPIGTPYNKEFFFTVQKYLFALGFKWNGGQDYPLDYPDTEYLELNGGYRYGKIRCGCSLDLLDGCKIINLDFLKARRR